MKDKSMQRSGTEAIRTQIQPSKPKREIRSITNSQNTKNEGGQDGKVSNNLFSPMTVDEKTDIDSNSKNSV